MKAATRAAADHADSSDPGSAGRPAGLFTGPVLQVTCAVVPRAAPA